ncbi:MAG: DUF4838 domain-containing protein, partial [Victivallaceae bacterium]|nr:DUF4838 domain-containing protein [Victivallaceae bacterium]
MKTFSKTCFLQLSKFYKALFKTLDSIFRSCLPAMIILGFINYCHGADRKDLEIVSGGRSQALIVIDGNAPKTVEFAARELQNYIKDISGCKLTIKKVSGQDDCGIEKDKTYIFVGESPYTRSAGISVKQLKADGFKIIARDNWLALLGRDYSGPPISGMRHPWILSYCYNPKLGLNTMGETGTLFAVYKFLEKYCGVRWYMPGKLGQVVPTADTIKIGPTDFQEEPDFEYRYLYTCLFPKDSSSALWYRRAGFGARFPVQINHSFVYIRNRYPDHPEYLALSNGRRDFKSSCLGSGNLCLSEPGTLSAFVSLIREYFNAHPEQDIYPVMPNDGMGAICECDKCQKQIDNSKGKNGRFSNYVWNFVNRVAKEVAKTHPDRFVGCCAYGPYADPPDFELDPNVVVMVCKTRKSYMDKKYLVETNTKIAQWRKKCKTLYIWEYYNYYAFDGANIIAGKIRVPVIFPHIIAEDLKFLKGKSKGEFIEAETSLPTVKFHYPGLMHLNLYITGKLLWNADLDVDKLLDEYYETFYGPAGQEMKRFFSRAEEIYTRPLISTDRNKIYSPQEEEELIGYLQEALTKCGQGVYRKRVELLAKELILEKSSSARPAETVPSVPGEEKQKGLVAYWKFDEGKGNIAGDSSGKNNNGCIYQGKWIKSPQGAALEFCNCQGYVKIPSSPSIEPNGDK